MVHYAEPLEPVARRVAGAAEAIHDRVASTLDWEDDGVTHIVITHRSDEARVFTFVQPERQIFFDIALPHMGIGLNDYSEWHEWLLTHELTHVAQLEARGGLYRPLSAIFGSWIRPSVLTPPWLKEGLAVYVESTLTPHGRGGSATYRMMMRAAVADHYLDDPAFATLDTISNYDAKSWPWSFRPYLFGYYLVRTLAERDPAAPALITQELGASLPTQLGPAIQSAGVESLDVLWDETLREIRTEANNELEKIRATPVTELEALTDSGYIHTGLTIAPNGHSLFATREDPEHDNAILRFPLEGDDVGEPEVLVERSTGYQTSISRSSRFVVFDQIARSSSNYLVSDLYIYDLKSADFVSASRGFRARDPDVHPDGQHIVFVANEGGKNRLLMTDTAWDNAIDLLGDVGYRRLSAPRFSPSGDAVAVSVHDESEGGEELWLVGEADARVLVGGGARNVQPTWSPDGRYLLYSSDRTGVYNIEAYDFATGGRFQVTNLVGGGFWPVVDPEERWLYLVEYNSKGYDVARCRFEPSAWRAIDEPSADEVPRADVRADVRADPPETELHAQAERYDGTSELAPQYLMPSWVLRPHSFQIGGKIGAVDPLFFQHYELDLRYDSATRLPVGRLFYFNGVLPMAFDLTLTHDAFPIAASERPLRTFVGALALNVPISEDGAHVFLRPALVLEHVDYRGATTRFGVSLGLRYDTEFSQIGYSFPEAGTFVDLELAKLANIGAARATVRTHLPLWWSRHALHLSAEGGAYFASAREDNAFFYAGSQASFPFELRSAYLLYGYPINALTGTKLAIGTALYTLSIADFQRGLVTVPISLGRLSGALRAQAGWTDTPDAPPGLPWSTGIELYQEVVVSYVFGLTAQLGLYRGNPRFGGGTQVLFQLTASGG